MIALRPYFDLRKLFDLTALGAMVSAILPARGLQGGAERHARQFEPVTHHHSPRLDAPMLGVQGGGSCLLGQSPLLTRTSSTHPF